MTDGFISTTETGKSFCIRVCFRVNEHSEDSYIAVDHFFAVLLLSNFQAQFIFFVKWKIISLSSSKIAQVTKNVMDF